MSGHHLRPAALVVLALFALLPPARAAGATTPARRRHPSWPTGVAQVSAAPAPVVVVALDASTAPTGISDSLAVTYRATVSAHCASNGQRARPCRLPPGRLTWRLDGADVDPGNFALRTRRAARCTRAVSARRRAARCVVDWPSYGDEWLTATYASRPSDHLAGRLEASRTLEVELRAPVDLAAGHTFAPYDNTGPTALEDCTLAAAADWIEATFDTAPSPQVIVAAYGAAEDTYDAGGDLGLTASQLFAFWRDVGIAGTRLTSTASVPLDEVASYLAGGHVLLSTAELPAGFPSGSTRPAAHAWLVVGDSARGPMLVTWGEELQVSWADFDAWTTGVWALETTKPS